MVRGRMGTSDNRIARCSIRVSKVGNRKLFSYDGLTTSEEDLVLPTRGDRVLYSPQLQLDEAGRLADFKGLHLDRASSLAHVDLDESGSAKSWRQRPGIMSHYEAAKRGEFRHLVFYKVSRIGRNTRDSLDLFEAFAELGVTIYACKEGIDSSNTGGKLLQTILLAVAEQEAENTSEFVRDAVLARARAGMPQGGGLPVWLKREDGEIVVVERVERAIQRMIDLRLEGLGYVRIARRLNEEGHRTRNGCEWTDGMVHRYLQPTWIDRMTGTAFINADYPDGHPERVVIPNGYPAILTPARAEVLRALQREYSRKPMVAPIPGAGTWAVNRQKRQGRYSADSRYLLSSRVYCGTCGYPLGSGNHGNDRDNTTCYFCHRARITAEPHEGGTHISGKALEDAVLRVVRHVLQEPPPAVRPKPKAPRKLSRTVESITQDIDRLLRLYLEGRLSDEDYQRQYEHLQVEREQLRASEELSDENAYAGIIKAVTELTQGRDSEEITRAELRQLVMLTVQRVEAPVTIPGMVVREGLTTLRRFARVTMNLPATTGETLFLAPIYTDRYLGERTLIPVS
jgi:DNA invertase Pin-like site-specific DNA recombinase